MARIEPPKRSTKAEMKEYNKYLKFVRRIMPTYNNDRKVIVLSAYCNKGIEILNRANNYEGNQLSDVYSYWSDEKQKAYDECYVMFLNSRHGNGFRICSACGRFFTVAWWHDEGLTYLTHRTEYLVVF